MNSFMYKDLAKAIEPLYDELSEHMVDGTADKAYLDNWKNRFQAAMEAANDRLEDIAETTGIDVFDDSGTSQSGRSGGFEAMTQEQGTKLEGLFTSGQMHWASIDEKMDALSDGLSAATDHLQHIEENTGYCKVMSEDIKKMIRDGLKMR